MSFMLCTLTTRSSKPVNSNSKKQMEQLTDLKAILHSKRANIYYLEKCRVMQKDGRVLYLTENKEGGVGTLLLSATEIDI